MERRKVRKAFQVNYFPDCERIVISVTEGTWVYLKRHFRAMYMAKPMVYEAVWVHIHDWRCLRRGWGQELHCEKCISYFSVHVIKHHSPNQLKHETMYLDLGPPGSICSLGHPGSKWQEQEAERAHLQPWLWSRDGELEVEQGYPLQKPPPVMLFRTLKVP